MLTGQPSSPSRNKSDKAFEFLSLPPELRDEIYKLCLIIGDFWIPRPRQLEDQDMRIKTNGGDGEHAPDGTVQLQLTLVSKQVRQEAMAIFPWKTGSCSRLPLGSPIAALDFPPDSLDSLTLDSLVTKHVRHLSLSMDHRQSQAGLLDMPMKGGAHREHDTAPFRVCKRTAPPPTSA